MIILQRQTEHDAAQRGRNGNEGVDAKTGKPDE